MIQTSVSGWLQRLVPVVAAAMAGALPGQAFAPHPLRPGAAASVAMPAAADRPKSLRQQESRELTRRCGAEWRALKAKGQIVELGRDVGERVEVVKGLLAGTRIVLDAKGLSPETPVVVTE